jgi:lipopolysaccharide transport system permease protein
MVSQPQLQTQPQPAESKTRGFAAALTEMIASRELLMTWTRREFRIRYSQSILGAAWAVVQPLALMVIFSVVFGFFLQVPTGGVPYPLFSFTGSLPWVFLASSLTFAIPSLVNNFGLVSKIYFPREILPLSSLLVCLIDFAIGAVLLIPLLVLYQVKVGPQLVMVPVLVLVQFMFSFGIILFLSAINVFFRDVRFVIPLALQIWMYISPVIYPASQVPESLRAIYFLNPMAVLIDSYRRVVLFNQWPDWPWLLFTTVVSIVSLMLGYRYFKRAERQFADVI